MEVINIPIEDLQPYEGNARNNRATVKELVKDIKRYGFQVPLVISPERVIIAGHARYEALKQLGWKEIPCVLNEKPSYLQDEYRIMDNKIGEMSSWDEDKLLAELRVFDNHDEIMEAMGLDFADRVLDEAGMNLEHDSQEDINKVSERMEGKMAKSSQDRNSKVKYCTCQHCGEEFGYKD